MMGHRLSTAPADTYVLANEELLECEGEHGMRCLCHLFRYVAGLRPLVCIVGNFDGAFATSTTTAIEVVATAVACRVGQSAFRLIEWYPHDAARRFSEVTLVHTPPEPITRAQVVIADERGDHPLRRTTTVVQFANPRWTSVSEDELAALLGEPAIRELRSFAGMPGDYVPERLFGTHGRQLADAVLAHNRKVAQALEAQLEEWTDG
jgi:hypothetical protein